MSSAAPLYLCHSLRRIEAHYLPQAQPPLMERAGLAAAQDAWQILGQKPGTVLVVAGPGNNGGDGFVLARHLREQGCAVTVLCATPLANYPADAAQAYHAWGGPVQATWPEGPFDLAVDAVFGIGLSRPITGRYRDWLEALNALACPVLAIDIPSGLDADTGGIWGYAVRASHTATFIAAKPGLFTLDGPDHAGHVRVHDLGLDCGAVQTPTGALLHPSLWQAALRPRLKNSHKGSHGSVGILGGAPSMVGAALLAGRAALQLGAGRVYVGLLDPAAPRLDPQQAELMLRSGPELLSSGQCTCLAIGPGLGQSTAAAELLSHALAQALPVVLDADALNLIAQDHHLAKQVSARHHATLLTPHPAEAARLLNTSTADIQSDRIRACTELAHRFRAYTVLKGCGSVLADPEECWWLNTTGNPGMGSAGMGDVLTGLLAALLAQGWRADYALMAGVYLHGAAADACVAQGQGPVGLSASELIPAARRLFNLWLHGHD